MSAQRIPALEIWALGGTIAMVPPGTPSGEEPLGRSPQERGGVIPELSARDLVDSLGGTLPRADYRVETLARKASSNLDLPFLIEMAEQIRSTDSQAVIITQGTDTLEETSFFLQQLLGATKRVIITGAMRSPLSPSADGPANLVDSIHFALSKPPRGVYVVMNASVHDPARVRKVHTSALEAFKSEDGPLATIAEGRVNWSGVPTTPTGKLLPSFPLPRVRVLTCVLDDDPDLIELAAEHADGLVVESYGAGHVSEAWSDILAEIAQTIPVVLASRTGAGTVFSNTYGYKGAEIDLQARGLVSAGRLDARKARLLLILALSEVGDKWRDWFKSRRG